MPSRQLDGSRTLVLGGSGELGWRIARELRLHGGKVVLAGRDADRLMAAATRLGSDVPSVQFDLRQPHHAEHVVTTALAALGGLDGLVNAAGVVAFGELADMDDSALGELIETDLWGPIRVIQKALPHLDGGFVVNITGVVAEQPLAGMAAYSAVKAGLSAATRALGRELRRKGIQVIDARPPHTETGLAGRAIAGTAPRMRDGLDPDEVARAIVEGVASGVREIPASAFLAP